MHWHNDTNVINDNNDSNELNEINAITIFISCCLALEVLIFRYTLYALRLAPYPLSS